MRLALPSRWGCRPPFSKRCGWKCHLQVAGVLPQSEHGQATRIGEESNVVDMLKNLIELDYDAVEAYETAIEKLADGTSKEALSGFKGDHERHVTACGKFV